MASASSTGPLAAGTSPPDSARDDGSVDAPSPSSRGRGAQARAASLPLASRRALLLALGGGLTTLCFADLIRHVLPLRAPAPAIDADTHPRAVVIGADGVDVRWSDRDLDDDQDRPLHDRRLPHLARLRRTGGLHPLRSEIPPESPVAWASALTGVNPGRHGIFDFVRFNADYEPISGLVDLRRMRLALGRIPVRPPQVRSRLAAPTFLERVYEAGYPVVSLRQPLLFPAPRLPGARMLSGLGTPDLAGGSGFYTVWSSRPAFPSGDTVFGGVQIPLDPKATPSWNSYLPGPVDPTLPRGAGGRFARARASVRFEMLRGGGCPTVAIHLEGRMETVPVGERSRFMLVSFELGTLPPITVRGHVRFEVKGVDPLVVLADPVNIYAPDALFPVTSSREYSDELFRRYGLFETVGWGEQTFALNDGYQDDAGFMRDLLDDTDRSAEILLGELARGGRCVFQVFTATDRGHHCFQRYYDPEHPVYVSGGLETFGDPMLQLYERIDRVVGEVQGLLDPEDLLMVCSDHGIATWRWGVNLNRWLVSKGYMTLRGSVPDQSLADYFHVGPSSADAVDWSRTQAYAAGLGQIYLNLRGREGRGIVSEADAPALVAEIRTRLLTLRNPYRPGDRPVREVYVLRDVYDGPEVGAAAELQVGFDAGYRVSWQTALMGGMNEPVFVENRRPWSGDHCSTDVSVVPGILLVNRQVPPAPAGQPYHVRDVAATVVDWFGLSTDDLDGAPVPLS